jgi:hypothetical protein
MNEAYSKCMERFGFSLPCQCLSSLPEEERDKKELEWVRDSP